MTSEPLESGGQLELKLAVATGYLQMCRQLDAQLDHLATKHHELTAGQAISAVRQWTDATRKSVYSSVREHSPYISQDG